MDGLYATASLVLAAAALYGLGLPLAWLLPAPANSAWTYRIATAPLYALVAAYAVASGLESLNISLQPHQLIVLACLAWFLAWHRNRAVWSSDGSTGERLRTVVPPALMIAASLGVWAASLASHGLYFPNRDFKNHAYFVAQVAHNSTSDPSVVLRPTPLSPESSDAFYPLGLHTLLGWSLPADWNATAITAASGILLASVSLPLAGIALARAWDPLNDPLAVATGFALIAFPVMTSAFGIGSVVVVGGAALYAAALASLWFWTRSPSPGTSLSLAIAGVGLLVLHVAEAWALLLVAVASLPWIPRETWRSLRARTVALLGALGLGVLLIAVVFVWPRLGALARGFTDIEPNTLSWTEAVGRAFLFVPGSTPAVGLVWAMLCVVGAWIGFRRVLAPLPVVAVLVPMLLAVLASGRGVPEALSLPTAPWYGSTGRIYMLAGPPMAVLGCAAIAAVGRGLQSRAPGRGRRLATLSGIAAAVALAAAVAVPIVPERRSQLAASLAGAGDTWQIGERLAAVLEPDETVLNFEGDGTATLFATSRIPVLAGWTDWEGPVGQDRDYAWLQGSLMRLDDPEVATAMRELRVGYIAIGTGSMYWNQQPGYDVESLAERRQLLPFLTGTDVTVLKYVGGSS